MALCGQLHLWSSQSGDRPRCTAQGKSSASQDGMGGFDGVLEDMLDAGDYVIGLGHYVGRYRSTGEQIRAQFAHVWTVKDGYVTQWRQYVDTKQFADAVSETPSMAERTR